MTDLNDFGDSLSSLSDEDLTELLRSIRLARRTPTKQSSTKKKTQSKSKSKTPKIDTGTMSPEMAAKILEQLGEG